MFGRAFIDWVQLGQMDNIRITIRALWPQAEYFFLWSSKR